ncbi:MAG: flavin reductase family protein [Elusimicrobiaceae bacterium]|jgi:ferric-chelate reductase [NAD(P)H]
MDEWIFKSLCAMTYGLYVVSSCDGEKLNGQITNTVFQVTADPARVAVGVNKKNLTHDYIEKTGRFSVSVLKQETPMLFIGLFGFKSGRDINKFEKTGYKKYESGVPFLLENSLAAMEITVEQSVDLGTHTLFIGSVVKGEKISDGPALTYDYYHNVMKGKTQKNATTYNVETSS